ncbi:MAG: GDSL-type esterase/lipase family protein [Gammaproteobacteria bacterium]|nr:GDSL-type esterase/lipase family protein [Gammaproteobacteria bacterium]MDP2139619.1 GDSL-type esterase/lipase family protein [Gammaproteobacteria bacterium]MDP2346592.1 GDSL-type esterase/lipase family protein [Gammaproteobacteria bacterium]
MITFRFASPSRILHFMLLLVCSLQLSAQELPDPARYEEAIQKFEEQDRLSPPPANAIVLTGSSSIMYWNEEAPADLAPLTVIPRGFGGTVMNDVLHYLDRVALVYKPRAILIYEGDNDTGRNNIPNDVIIDQLEKIISRIHTELPETRIYVLAVKPSVLRVASWPVAQALNERYKAIADTDPLVTYIDTATPFLKSDGTVMTDIFVEDNLHLNEKGYDIWAAAVREVLIRYERAFE